MPAPATPPVVSRLWRTLAIGLMLGIAAYSVFHRKTPVTPIPPMTVRGDPLPTPDPRLDTMLDSVDFNNTPLGESLQKLADRAGLNLVVTWGALQTKNIEQSTPVSLHLKQVTFASALEALLLVVDRDHSIIWNEFGGIVQLNLHELEDPKNLLVRFYDVRRILDHEKIATSKPNGDQSADDIDAREGQLCKLITDNVLPFTWKDNGGELGSISCYPGTLIIAQTTQAHRMIEALLCKLDNVK